MEQQPRLAPSSSESELLDIAFANISLEHALKRVTQALQRPDSDNLFFVNAHCLNTTFDNDDYRRALGAASLVLPDGSGIKAGCEMNGEALTANLNGTDLFPHLCELFSKTGDGVFLLGAAPGTAERVAEWAQTHAPGLTICGCRDGFFSDDDENALIAQINRSGARVLFVAMGVPRQELWLQRVRDQLNTRLNIAVGGLFEFYGGNIPRAPLWMRKAGIEWTWRLLQEPGRMWRRYLVGNPLYLSRVWREKRSRLFQSGLPLRLGTSSQRYWFKLRAEWRRQRWGLRRGLVKAVRRSLDIAVAATALVLLVPLFALIALAIKLDTPGPVLFGQIRAGYRGRQFRLWKFRSMVVNAEALRAELESRNEMAGGVLFKIKADPRITRVGRWLRKLSLDELPQLWNVLRGEMSLVGPRPALHSEVLHYSSEQRMRLDVRPGLTSDWVVRGRSLIPFEQQAQLDIDYVHRRSLWRDLKLLLKTLPSLISGRGAS